MTNDEPENQDRTKVAIRLATPSDATMLARLRYAFRSSLGQICESDESFVERCTIWMQERLEKADLWKCWVAQSGDVPVGNLWAQLIEKVPNPTSEPEYHAYLTNFYVREDCRGHGIGSMLLLAALAWVETNDVHTVILWPTKQSRSLYLRHGFSDRQGVKELIIKIRTNGSVNDERETY